MAKRLSKLEKRILARNQERDVMMERTAGLVTLNRIGQSDAAQLHGFMAIFHPNYSEQQVRELSRDIERNKRG